MLGCCSTGRLSSSTSYRDFDPLWWGPNVLLMVIPALALGSMVCRRLETAENHS